MLHDAIEGLLFLLSTPSSNVLLKRRV